MKHRFVPLFWFSMTMTACYGEIVPIGGDDTAPDGGVEQDTGSGGQTAVTWQKTIGPLLVDTKCTSCHGTQGKYSVETYAAAFKGGADSVPNVIAGNAASTLVTYCDRRHGGISASDSALVKSWVMSGARER